MKSNPILPRNAIKAMDEGWTGFPTWSIQPTISAHQLTGNPPKKPPFGLFFVFNKDEEKAADGLDAVEGTLLGQFGHRREIDEGAMIELMFPYPNWKDNLIPWLAEKKLNLRDIALYKAHIELRKVKIIDDLTFHHEGSIRGEQMEKVKNWVDSIDFETGMITDTPEYRAWMIASGLFLEPDFRQNPPGIPRDASQLSTEEKKDIRKRWQELVNMTATELQTFYDSDLGNKKAGLSREQAKEAGISSGRDSALAIIKMKQTPVKEWHKRHSKDRGRDIMLDFWQWAQKQINFNTRHRGMRGPYLDEKGRPTRKLLGLWIWGHDPWRYSMKVKKERMPKCPDVPWIGSAEKKRFGVLPKENPKFKVLLGNIITVSGPSSSGKSTIAKGIRDKMRAKLVPSYMTREPRPNEVQGVDGFFVSVERFEDMISNGDFTTSEGVELWVKQKNGEYYGRRVSDFMSSKPVVVDVNFEGLRKMREAFPGRTYSVFIRTKQGEKRRRENLERRGVHTEEEIEARVRAGTGMLNTFQNMNFDFIASNKYGELEKNVAMIASEFRKWQPNPKFPKPSKRCTSNKPCGGKVIYKSRGAANKAINSGLAGGHTAYHSPQCQDKHNRSVYHTRTTSYMFNPPAIRMGAELLHKPSGLKHRFIEALIEDGKTWYIIEDMSGERSRIEDDDFQFYSLWPKSSLWKANPPVGDFDGAMEMGFQHEGTTKYHGHLPKSKPSSVPEMSKAWKKATFRHEMPLTSREEADGTYTMGFLEQYQDDERPYIVSIKVDGDSNIVEFDGNESVMFTPRGRWRKDFHLTNQITASLKKNGVSSAIILGELYAVDENENILPLGQQRGSTQSPKDLQTQRSMRFAAFDIIELNGKNIDDMPYAARMNLLKPLIKGDAVKVVKHWRSKGGLDEVREAWNFGSNDDLNFEGLVVRFDGDDRSIKVKMQGTADLAVLGFYYGEKGGRDEAIIGGGALAWMDENGDFVLAGNSVLGSSMIEKGELLERLLPTAVDAPRVKWGDHIVDRSITHDERGRGAITPIEPHLIGEFKYRSINYSERPVYRFEDGHYHQVGTTRAPVLQQCTFGRWRPDKELTPQDLRMEQVAAEGKGKWKKNPHKQDGPYAWWEPDPRGHQIYNKSSSLQFINNQLVGDQNISRRDVFNTVAAGVERKYGVRYQIVSPKEAEQIDYLKDMDAFFDGRNYGTWDEKNGVVYFNEEMFNDRKTALRELGHETGAVIIASMYGGKDNIPRVDHHGMNQKAGLTHLVDSYTFGYFEPKPGPSQPIPRRNPDHDEDDTTYPGGTAQFLIDGILLGSLESKMNDWRTQGVSKKVILKDWPVEYPELAARLQQAQQLGWETPAIPKVKVNPPPKPRKKGKRKEPAKSYLQRFMGHPKMVSEFPDSSQRYAVGLSYVEKFYGKQSRERIAPPRNPQSETKIIDLSNLSPSLDESESLEVFTDGQPSKNKFSPMFVSPISAKKASPTNSIHLVVPGLMPAPQEGWKKYRRNQIFYMPNDVKPHFHGAATHHLGDGFALNRAFIMSSENFVPTEKELVAFRDKIKGFSDGQANTPVETWIHWKIPTDEKEYPTLRVQKDSIIWWDHSDMHNLSYVKSADRYKQNKSDSNDILIEDNVNDGMNIVATIMDKVGKFHFLCSVPGHAGLGHKIVIDVVERTKMNPVYRGIKEAHEHYDYPGSHRTGSVISDGVVVRSYSTGEIDTISADESKVKYKIETKALNDAFKMNKSEQKPVRFFLKKSDGVHDMGLYDVAGVRNKVATMTKQNPLENPPKKTPGGKTIPKRYLKGLTKEEMQIAIKEIDKGYKYDVDDPEAYEYWKSDIKATARGYKTVPSKYKKEFIKLYGPLPEKGKFIDKIAKATKIKKRILKKVYDKGLAAWRTGHRPGVQQHQWAAGRVYSFVTLGNTVVKNKKKMSDYTLAVEAGLIKDGDLIKKNPPLPRQNKPFPWNQDWIAKSPLKTLDRARKAERKYNRGGDIGFTYTSSLKSMGRIKRSHGQYEVGEKYAKMNGYGYDPKLQHNPYTLMTSPDGTIFPIDNGLAPLIQYFWDHGIKVGPNDQGWKVKGHPEETYTGLGYIVFPEGTPKQLAGIGQHEEPRRFVFHESELPQIYAAFGLTEPPRPQHIKENGVLPIKKGGTFPKAGYIYDPPGNEEYASHVEVQKNMRKYNKLVKDWMNKNHNASWSWRGDFKTEAEKKKFKQAKAYAKENIDGPIVCSEECIACFYKQGGMTEAEIRERAKGVKENPPSTNLEWEHRTDGPKRGHTLFGRDETGGGVAVRFNVRDGRARVESIGLRDQVSMAIDSGVFEGKRLSQQQISELEDLDDGRSGLQLKDGMWVEDLSYEPEMKGKGYGQAAYLKLLDYADEVWSPGRSAKATRAWEALERRQDELGIVVERIPRQGRTGRWEMDGFLLKRQAKGVKENPPHDIEWEIRPHPDAEDEPDWRVELMVGVIDGKDVIEVHFTDEKDKIHIDHISIDRDFRGLGYSRPTLDWFKQKGKPIELFAPVQSKKSSEKGRRDWYKGMYERQGFVEIDAEKGLMRWEPQKKNGPPRQAVEIPTVIVFKGMIRRELADGFGSEDGIFIFGDNEARRGKGGQAKELRGLDNAYGIRTKKRPSLDESAFWSDKTYKTNIKMMSEDFLEAFMAAGEDGTLYVPQNGIGTGMAQLKSRAPKTYKWLKTFLDNLIRTGGEQDVKDNIKKWRMN